MEHPHAPMEDVELGGWLKFPAWPEIVGGIAVLAPFVVKMEVSTSVNGKVVSYSNLPATIGGGVAAVCGVVALLMLGKTARAVKLMRVLAAVALVGGGAFQIARGTGALLGDSAGGHAARPSDPAADIEAMYRDTGPDTEALVDACTDADPSTCAEARAAVERACAAAKPDHCATYGMFLLEGTGGPVDEAGAAAAFAIGCDAGEMQSCTNSSLVYYTGKGVDKDLDKALQFALQGCDGGNGNGCRNYGVILRDDKHDFAGARDAMRRGCEAPSISATACEHYGHMLLEGIGGPADAAASRAVNKRGCEVAHSEIACWNLAIAQRDGTGGDSDAPGAVASYRRACEYGDSDGCNEAGVIIAHGADGVPVDLGEAARLYARSCEGGTNTACSNIGVFLRDGTGVEKNITEARARFERGCELESGWACYHLGDLYWNGNGVTLDRETAKQLFTRACELKLDNGCAAAKRGPPDKGAR